MTSTDQASTNQASASANQVSASAAQASADDQKLVVALEKKFFNSCFLLVNFP